MKALTLLALAALLLPAPGCGPRAVRGAGTLPATFIADRLPDTGQTSSFTEVPGEDADYTINPPAYADTGDGVVMDLVSGLTWQKEDDDRKRTWVEAGRYCDDLELGGHEDWRLPSRNELLTITYYEWVPAVNGTFFPRTKWTFYWSTTEDLRQPTHAFEVSFEYGDGGTGLKTLADDYTRCVRGRPLRGSDFLDNGDGTVSDRSTGLTWQKGEGGRMDWRKALTYCEGLSLAGHDDWRLPNVREIASIMDLGRGTPPVIDINFFPETHPEGYWSSTSYQQTRSFHAFAGYFQHGYIGRQEEKTYDGYYVRCLRGP